MAIKEKALSDEDSNSFKEREKELKSKVTDEIHDFAEKEVLTDKTLLKGLKLDGDTDDDARASKRKARGASGRTTQVADDEEEEAEEAESEELDEEAEGDDVEGDSDDDAEGDDSEETEEESGEDGEAEEELGEAESDEETEGETEEDEELDPKSKKKVQKRIDNLTAKNKALEAELEKMRSNIAEDDDEPDDPRWKNLEKIYSEHGQRGLEQLQDEIAVEIRKAKTDEDAMKLQRLSRLAQKFEREAPERFRRKQLREFQKVVVETHKSIGKDVFARGAEEIFKLANAIYLRSKTLQGSVTGQAEAWKLAEEHWTETRKKSRPEDKAEKLRLKRSLNKLKQRTVLAGKRSKGGEEKPQKDLKKMREKARSGNTEDKLAYLKETLDFDSMIPDDLKG